MAGFKFNPVTCNLDLVGSGGGGGGANTSLSNLTSPTAINQSLIFGAGVAGLMTTADIFAYATTPSLTLKSGTNSWGYGGNGASGDVNIGSGDTNNGITGGVNITTAPTGIQNTGSILIQTGGAGSSFSGGITLQTGNSEVTDSGTLLLKTGTSPGTRGPIKLDAENVEWTGTPGSLGLTIGAFNESASPRTANIYTADATGANVTSSLSLFTGNSDSTTTGDLVLETGSSSTGGSGSLTLSTGTGTSRGDIKLKNGSEGTAGKVWISTNTSGSGAWDNTGATGSFTTSDLKTVTVVNGIITSIV